LVLADHIEPRDLKLGSTILKMYRKELLMDMTGVLVRNLVRGSFYSHYPAWGATFGLVGE
jgi:hypothetical protein